MRDVSLQLDAGSLTVITGRVGSGKTTLLRALLGLVPAQAGVILWNGVPIDRPDVWMVPPRCASTTRVTARVRLGRVAELTEAASRHTSPQTHSTATRTRSAASRARPRATSEMSISCDRPAPPNEPDRVGALTTTGIKRRARDQPGDLGDEPALPPPAPHRSVALAVPCVPLGSLRRVPNRCPPVGARSWPAR